MTDKHFHSGKPRPSSMNSTHPPPTELHGTTRAQTSELPKAALEHPRSRGSTYHRTPYPNTNAGTGSYPASSRDQTPFESTKGMKKVGRHSGYSPAASWVANELGFNPHDTLRTTHPQRHSESHSDIRFAQYRNRPSEAVGSPSVPQNLVQRDWRSEGTRPYGKRGTSTSYGGKLPSEEFRGRPCLHREEQNNTWRNENSYLKAELTALKAELAAQKAHSAQLAAAVGQWQSSYDRASNEFRFLAASPVRGGSVGGGDTAEDLVPHYRCELEQTTIYARTLEDKIAGLEGYIKATERLLKQYVTDDVSRTMRRHDRSGGK